MSRFICIHGHFYQPPRENPWFERIEVQDSAYPFHDWNERITAECYAPNSAARILDEDGLITSVVNNYSMISFNAGPTLLSWLEDKNPTVYLALIEADRIGSGHFKGHGPAIAQCYNHMIMPLATLRDKKTQVRWGIEDFHHRFGREPEGMWLPELAVDRETLGIMADEGIGFVILEPHQVRRVRSGEDGDWMDLPGGWLDPTIPYRVDTGNGQDMAVFVNNDGIAHKVAFGNLLRDGHWFADHLRSAFDDRPTDQLVHFAIDGETYGHHYRFGEMALAYCLSRLESEGVRRTVYGEYLADHPPVMEIEIHENTAWSCPHALSRWKGGCTCSTGAHPDWSLAWRGYLRAAFDLLRDRGAVHFEHAGSAIFADPWAARDDYIRVINERSREVQDAFLKKHADHPLTRDEHVNALELLEMQRNLMLMYTSCGWFFDDISGIEAVQVMWYAARAMQLCRLTGGDDPEEDFLQILGKARSNRPGLSDGATVWQRLVVPYRTDLRKVCGQYALTSLFCSYPATSRHDIYQVTRCSEEREQEGVRRIAVGKAGIQSLVTCESKDFSYAAVYPGGPDLIAGVVPYAGDQHLQEIRDALFAAFWDPDSKTLYRELAGWFGDGCLRGTDLLRDEARRVVRLILKTSIRSIEDSFQDIYRTYLPLMEAMHLLDMPIPEAIAVPVGHILNRDLITELGHDRPDPIGIAECVDAMQRFSISPDKTQLSYLAGNRLRDLIRDLLKDPENASITGSIIALIDAITELSLDPPLWEAQNAFIQLRDAFDPAPGDSLPLPEMCRSLIEQYEAVGAFLGVRL
ncbi:MAG: DUF3536 domain-containing protein [Methanocalculus sp. MSAO_Arc1]|uniref:DUF3536 domain-containing protein n=1 Tax=Methanocalculus TaxID=71151 RepID=UPI000FEF7DC7|nr:MULTISPECIES: DUF3536 domain-containing protein [unclassified Methanocalculus]MCP1662650.1 alpha-amylase/alpha-mannosidase (GH57 family) [Methanocalculus sp. AMF5]RQD80319.1 MAG: DUF3536 domain-containing protein [Methanocalculus sp. MSAO_Arc1]